MKCNLIFVNKCLSPYIINSHSIKKLIKWKIPTSFYNDKSYIYIIVRKFYDRLFENMGLKEIL